MTQVIYVIAILAVILVVPALTTVTRSGSVGPSTNSIQTIPYSGGANKYALVTLTPSSSSDVGSMLMFVKASAGGITSDYTNISKFQHQSPTSSFQYDLEHANTGSSQVVQLNLGTGSTTLHITILSYEISRTLSYTVTSVQSANSDTSLCQQGTAMSTEIYCSSCSSQRYIGAFCHILQGSISKDVTYVIQLKGYTDPNNFVSFTIPGSQNKISLFYSVTSHGLYNFIQFEERDEQVAGWMNYVLSGGKNRISKANTQYTVNINSDDKDIAVSFWNPNNHQVNITLWYTEQSSSNLLLIILAVLGGILFVMLVIVAIYIVKKMRSNDMRQIAPNSPLRQTNRRSSNTENMLSASQIDTYFPAVLCRNIYQHEQSSSNNLMNEKQQKQEDNDRDCVICLCPIETKDMMRVTYCRHLFHSHCLTKWFEKNRNCPYCREQYTKKSTIEKYQSLLRSVNKTVLIGVDLVAQLALNKPNKSMLIVEDIKD